MNALKSCLDFLKNDGVVISNIKLSFFIICLCSISELALATNINKTRDKSLHKSFLETNSVLEDLYKKIENIPPKHLCDPQEESFSSNGVLKDVRGRKLNISSVSLEKASKIFNDLASDKRLPFGYPDEGCYARAHKMALLLDEKEIVSGKVFLEGDLMVWTKENPPRLINWGYHTAVILKVKDGDSKEEPYVFDPSLFKKPVPVKVWRELQTRQSSDKTELYFTKRFNYDLFNSQLDINDYTSGNLEDMKKSLKENLERQNLREAIKNKSVL